MNEIRLRGRGRTQNEVYSFGDIPDNVIISLAGSIVHHIAIGRSDITGDDFGNIFAKSIRGEHLLSSQEWPDVIKACNGWSAKTVKATKPYTSKKVRLISGRNSLDYSLKISDPRANPEATGRGVLQIWNERIRAALKKYGELRIIVLLRNFNTREFLIFEEQAELFAPDNYAWSFNNSRNLEGKNIATSQHTFTWQPHGSQFTIIRDIPGSARKFKINHNIPIISEGQVLKEIEFDDSWVTIEELHRSIQYKLC